MQHAYRHCFAEYKACPTYLELLVERRVRRCELSVLPYAHAAHYDQAESSAEAEVAAA
ncbi:MAG TPA: hypothetical protein VF624_13005 [Tepidisphaeraceae bacterium]